MFFKGQTRQPPLLTYLSHAQCHWSRPKSAFLNKKSEKKKLFHLYLKTYYSRFIVAKMWPYSFFARIFVSQQDHIVIFESVNRFLSQIKQVKIHGTWLFIPISSVAWILTYLTAKKANTYRLYGLWKHCKLISWTVRKETFDSMRGTPALLLFQK